MLHQLYQYDDAIIRWSWRHVRGGRGGAGITADDDDTGTTLAVSNIGLVKRWLRLMSFECSSLIREREPLRYWLSVARRWEFHRIWECNLSAWMRCVVFKKHQRSRSLTLSLSRWAIEESLSITGYNDNGRAANSKIIIIIERKNERCCCWWWRVRDLNQVSCVASKSIRFERESHWDIDCRLQVPTIDWSNE